MGICALLASIHIPTLGNTAWQTKDEGMALKPLAAGGTAVYEDG
jgi:hypothetical protein